MAACTHMCKYPNESHNKGNLMESWAHQASDTLVHKLYALALMLAQAAAQKRLNHHAALHSEKPLISILVEWQVIGKMMCLTLQSANIACD